MGTTNSGSVSRNLSLLEQFLQFTANAQKATQMLLNSMYHFVMVMTFCDGSDRDVDP